MGDGGECESRTARHGRFFSGGPPAAEPQGRPPASTGVRGLRRDRAPSRICDASRARPSPDEDVRSYSSACSRSQEQSQNIAPALTRTRTLSPLRERVACTAGRERGRARSATPPLPARSARHPPPHRGEGKVPRLNPIRLGEGSRVKPWRAPFRPLIPSSILILRGLTRPPRRPAPQDEACEAGSDDEDHGNRAGTTWRMSRAWAAPGVVSGCPHPLGHSHRSLLPVLSAPFAQPSPGRGP